MSWQIPDLEIVFQVFPARQTWAFQHFQATVSSGFPAAGRASLASWQANQPFMTPWSKWPRSTSKSWPKKRTGRCIGSGRIRVWCRVLNDVDLMYIVYLWYCMISSLYTVGMSTYIIIYICIWFKLVYGYDLQWSIPFRRRPWANWSGRWPRLV